MKPYVFEIAETDPVQLFEAVHNQPYALLLDSADRNHPNAQKSFIFFAPLKIITNGFDELEKHLKERSAFAAGYFGYDLGRTLEKLPQDTIENKDVPIMAIGLYDFAIEFDHAKQKAQIIIYAENPKERKQEILHVISQTKPELQNAPSQLHWTSNFTENAHKEKVQKIIDYIHEGDIFQANLSQRFSADLPEIFNTWEHYKALRQINPAPFASYFNCGDIKISSASPERFLVLQDDHVETRPIKGTLPRSMPKEILENNEKDRAENIMIVDLLRNDLSKVCETHSIEVPELCKLETFANVHHLVSTVTGKLKENQTALDLLKACFPGGSITGAPKIRSMEIIEELETHSRGPYCGAMGYITPDGNMDTNILIRTLIYNGDKVSFNVGGGITAASTPAAEYQETLDKAKGIFESFGPKEKFEAAE
ncbi:aminodeoxychorismate synthase component I [Alphaproteobacteria bacterium]|nr:aminodeoxychorismate synthase component I [Alphaproteobacteria bacterium]